MHPRVKCKMKHEWVAKMNVLNERVNPRDGTTMATHKHSILRTKSNTQHVQFTTYACNAILMISKIYKNNK